MIDLDIANEFISFYFFALMQKSNKKNQGCKKMAKNCIVSLNPANSPQCLIRGNVSAGSDSAGFLTASSTIFLTPFF
jgi:hypothetical protein